MSYQLPPGTYQLGHMDYSGMTTKFEEFTFQEPKWKDRFLTQAELEMEELLLGERHESVFYPNVWDPVVPGYPEKVMHYASKLNSFGGGIWILKRFDNSTAYDRDDRIVVTTEFESPEELARISKSYRINIAQFDPKRPVWAKDHIVTSGHRQTITIRHRYEEKPPKDRTNNGAKWKKQTKPYHQR